MSDEEQEGRTNLDLTRMWGASTRIAFDSTGVNVFRPTQVGDVRLPEACVCTIYFQAEVISPASVAGVVNSLNLELIIGLGLTVSRRTISFAGVPVIGTPLQFTIPYQPAANVLAQVSANAAAVTPGDTFELQCTLQVSPLARMPVTKEPLKFGMALPGEADALDDELVADLEQQHPEEADIMRARQLNGMPQLPAPGEEEEDDEDEEPTNSLRVPRHLQNLVARLERRLGRVVTVRDLPPHARRQVVKMVQASRRRA